MWSGYSCSAAFIGGVADLLGFDRPATRITVFCRIALPMPQIWHWQLFLIVSDIYEHCDLALKAAASGDRSAVFVMFIIAPIATGLVLW